MATYLVTGRSGTGKSSLCAEFNSRGILAFDGDKVPGLPGWVDKQTGASVEVDNAQPVDLERFGWYWRRAVLDQLLKAYPDVIVCGSADNQLELFDMFKAVFVLTLEPEEQRRRILERTSHNYGKHPAMQDLVLREQQQFVKQAVASGATAVSATPTVKLVADRLLDQINALPPVATK